MTKFQFVAMGGTFDIIHKGHMALLSKAFSISSNVIIGLVSDELAAKKGKKPQSNYSQRLTALRSVIEKNFPKHPYEISELENDFGPAVVKGSVQALVVSEKTSNKGSILNELRRKEKLPPVEIVQVSMVLAEDGKAISTTRIKNSEIDSDGNLNWQPAFLSLSYSNKTKISQPKLMSITNRMLKIVENDVFNLKDGMHPDNIAYWYQKIIAETKEMAPPWLVDKISVKQDPILTMKFNVDISKRAVRYFIQVVDNNMEKMPYSTRLYFLKVQEIMSSEMDKSLV